MRSRIERDIEPNIGNLLVESVKPVRIDAMLKTIMKRGASTIANDVLRWVRRMFHYAIKRHTVQYNPAAAFDLSDAGGKETPRDRSLSREELVKLFEAMRIAMEFTNQNALTVKLLLLLAVRKQELTGTRQSEFDLIEGIWHMPAGHLPEGRTKTGAAIDIHLAPQATDVLRDLFMPYR